MLDNPQWRGKPLVVGSMPDERGVVSTCSYEARRFGVRSAMPSCKAYELCPHAIFVHPRIERYEEVSRHAFEIFYSYTPYVEGVSVDEAFLDITGSLRGNVKARELAMSLMQDIKTSCGVTCSCGIASNRLLAKIGSDENKPAGLTVMPRESRAIAEFLAPKSISVLWGVGKKTIESLKPYGITTCGDIQRLAAIAPDFLPEDLVDYAFGRSDDNVYWQDRAEKSVSREYTFSQDETSRAKVRAKLMELVGDVGYRFRKEKRWAKTAKIKLSDSSFHTITRQKSFSRPACDDTSFRSAALNLFDKEEISSVRLIGFGVSGIVDSPGENDGLFLFEDEYSKEREKREKLSKALDILRAKGLLIN
jgi:DNA polymerase-4